jgi:hypothetical protein
MRILLDEQLPRRLTRAIPGHDVRTAQQEGWSGVSNGALLRVAAAAGFEVMITADRNLQFQQRVSGLSLGIIVLITRSTKIEDLMALVPGILDALTRVQPGQILLVSREPDRDKA